MIGGTLSHLVETIQKRVVPGWLHDYVLEHENEIRQGLVDSGQYVIPCPTGEQIVIEVSK